MASFVYAITAITLSVRLYLDIPCSIWQSGYVAVFQIRQQQMKGDQQNSAVRTQLKKQAKITKVMSLIVLSTFVLVVIPQTGSMILSAFNASFAFWSAILPYFSVMLCSNSALTVIYYSLTSADMRRALRGTICFWRPMEPVGPTTLAAPSMLEGPSRVRQRTQISKAPRTVSPEVKPPRQSPKPTSELLPGVETVRPHGIHFDNYL